MCGIVAAVAKNPALTLEHAPSVERILDAMAYRGPDARGIRQRRNVIMGHRRLSIIDLSDAGRQPMHDVQHGLHIVFNGEIYNYKELRGDLEDRGYRFRTHTDTEAILGAYHVYGSQFLEKLRGMFAFVLHDESAQKVFLCRDRMGKKPLYYYFDSEQLLVCSEIKFLYAFQAVPLSIAWEHVRAFFALQYVPGTATFLNEINKIAPGECLELDLRTWRTASTRYWRVSDHLGSDSSSDIGIRQVDEMIRESVRYRLVADVEIGILLSGGRLS